MSMFNDRAALDRLRGSSADHVRRYRESGGADGHVGAAGLKHLLLTTTGRHSGEQRTTPLIYGQDGDRYVIVASVGGADRHPAWYLNLVADPKVEVQVGADRFTANARPAGAAERPALWKLMAGLFPNYDQYQSLTKREIPVVILERAASK